VPNVLPFSFEEAPGGLYVRRTPYENTEKALDAVYRFDENAGYLQDGNTMATSYGGDFLRFLSEYLKSFSSSGRQLMEIGSGGGWLLQRLAKDGWNCISCDPSPFAERAAREQAFHHIADYYSPGNDYPMVDVIVHYDVLEHVENPVEFLRWHTKHLRPQGMVFFATPDCTEQFQLGDVSMAVHEHRNYFSVDSLAQVVRSAGLLPLSIQRGAVGGVLQCAAVLSDGTALWDVNDEFSIPVGNSSWARRANARLGDVRSKLSDAAQKGDRVGLFVPLRGFTYAGPFLQTLDVVLIDDDPSLAGRYYDGVEVPVNGSEILDQEHLALILAMTTSYHNEVVRRIRMSHENSSTPVITPYDPL